MINSHRHPRESGDVIKFVLGIYSAPSQPGALSGFCFAEALLAQNHEISQIFFYQDGVLNSCCETFFSQFIPLNIPLLVCSTALYKRNISENQLIKGFTSGSLTQFSNSLLKADRYVIFAN